MRILLFSGGFPEYMIELANALAQDSEVESVMLVLPRVWFESSYAEQIHPKVLRQPIDYIFYVSIRQNLKMMRELLGIIKNFRPDVFHVQANGHPWLGTIIPFLPKKCKLVNTIHDPELHIGDKASTSRDYRFSKWMCKRRSNAFIVHGESLKTALMNSYGLKSERIHIVPHGHLYMYKYFQKGPEQREEPYNVLFFGRIWEYKGLKYLMQAEPLITEKVPGLRIVIAGTGEEMSIYDPYLKHPENYILKNYRIPLEEVANLFEQAAVVVLPYIEATQSGVIPVAYPFGKPVVASNVGALPEVVVDGETGFLVPPANPEALAEKITELLLNPELRHQMGIKAKQFSEDKLSWKKIAKATLEVYKNS